MRLNICFRTGYGYDRFSTQERSALTHNKRLPKVRIFQSRCLTLEVTRIWRNIRVSFFSISCLSIKGLRA